MYDGASVMNGIKWYIRVLLLFMIAIFTHSFSTHNNLVLADMSSVSLPQAFARLIDVFTNTRLLCVLTE
jgi:hypothetical protein